MKRMENTIRTQGSALALALTFLLAGCGFALFRALVAGMASGSVGSPTFLLF